MTKYEKGLLRLEAYTSSRKDGQPKNTEKRQNVTTVKRHIVQMLKPNRNVCKNGKQTNLLPQGARSAVQKSQIPVDTKQLSVSKKVCIIHMSDISYRCLANYVHLKQSNQNI